ncbi:hypothetical protein [Mycobacterium conspicuum]|uniref:Uncharacterized protein n=1 Tax=Mycobacterium conspicuum TaxID=44010 RepID=A0A1X1SWM0_9MYCO|nr:hypothetical protein [Mycobacterium conspicuum]ORV35324.1 hypothetical protein AWC00_25165 [Mycobacterium conspicuum]BBZ37369.1 hypothetical protein MCNS_04320 [Mycobacterium conspicuum]
MHHGGFSDWFNYQASLKILLFSMLAGAALPGLFALGLRLQAVGNGYVSATKGGTPQRNPMLLGIAWVIYAVVVLVILFALAYISREFIAHHTHYPFLGAKAT